MPGTDRWLHGAWGAPTGTNAGQDSTMLVARQTSSRRRPACAIARVRQTWRRGFDEGFDVEGDGVTGHSPYAGRVGAAGARRRAAAGGTARLRKRSDAPAHRRRLR